MIGQHDAPARVSAHVLSRAAGGRHTERAEREAQVLTSAAAEPAGATRQRWIDGDAITDAQPGDVAPGLDHGAGHLVTWHHRQHAVLAGEDVEVGAAEPDGGDLDDYLARPRHRIVDRRDLDRARPGHHHGSHA